MRWRTSCTRNLFSSFAAVWFFSAGWYVKPHKCTHLSLTSAESRHVPAVTALVLEWPQRIPREKPISIQIIGELVCTCAPGCPNRNWDRQTKILMKCVGLPRESMGEKDMGGRGEKSTGRQNGWQHLSLFIYHCCVLMSRPWKSYDRARQTHMGGTQHILIFISFCATSASHLVAPVTSMVHIIWQPKKSSCNYGLPIKKGHAELVYLWVIAKSFPVPKSRPARAWNKSEYFYRKVVVLVIWRADSGVLQQVEGANSGHNSVLERRITGINVHLQLIKLRRSVAWEHNVRVWLAEDVSVHVFVFSARLIWLWICPSGMQKISSNPCFTTIVSFISHAHLAQIIFFGLRVLHSSSHSYNDFKMILEL